MPQSDESQAPANELGFRPDGTLPPFLGSHASITNPRDGSPYAVSMRRACELLGFSDERRSLLHGLLEYRAALRGVGVRHGLQLIAGSFTEHGGAEPNDIDVTTVAEIPPHLLREDDSPERRAFLPLSDARQTKSTFHVDAYLFAAHDILQALPNVLRMFALYSHTKSRGWKGMLIVDLRSDDDAARHALTGPLPQVPSAPRDEDSAALADRLPGAPRLLATETADRPPFAIRPGRPIQSAPWAKCLPMAIAESWGWDVTIHEAFEAAWTGGAEPAAVTLEGNARVLQFVTSHFGHGILTIRFPYIMRTPQGWNLHVRGPVNRPRPDLEALEGVIETDWSIAPFSFNWKILTPGRTVRFEVGDVIGRLVPVQRGVLETFDPVVMPLTGDRALAGRLRQWNRSRSKGPQKGTSSEYTLGRFETGPIAAEHQVSLRLAPFRRTV